MVINIKWFLNAREGVWGLESRLQDFRACSGDLDFFGLVQGLGLRVALNPIHLNQAPAPEPKAVPMSVKKRGRLGSL